MKNLEQKDITGKKMVWTITNFTSLKTNARHSSDVFIVGDCAWKLYIYRGRTDNKSLSIYLEAANALSLPKGWIIIVDYCITVVNQVSRIKSQKGDAGSPVRFHESCFSRGYHKFMLLNELEAPHGGYVRDDKCVVEVDIFSVTFEGFEPTSRPIYPSVPKQPNDIHSEDDGGVNFKDLGYIDKALVPLLEEVCSWYPSLLDCNKKRSRRFSEWAFTCLGQVLQFLKKNKWKDMNEEACEQLQALWEELEMSRMDLSWLDPHVKSALNMKAYLEKEMKVKRLRQDLAVLEAEVNKMKENLANTEQTVEVTIKDLIRAEEGFEEIDLDLDTEIGYGKP